MSSDSTHYDSLIVGAGPAGCAAAYDLARAGKRVLLIDKRTFPRPKACASGLTRKTLQALRYPVTPIIERVCHEVVLQNSPTLSAPSSAAASSQPKVGSQEHGTAEIRVHTRAPIAAMAVRSRFDAFCLQKTLSMGAELLKIDTILALREHPDHIELDIQTSTGPVTLTAPVLIGADGSSGQTRRLSTNLGSEPAWYTRGFALEACVPYSALPATLPNGNAPHDLIFDFAPLPGGYGWLFPKGDHINIGVGSFAEGPKADPETQLKRVTRTLLTRYAFQQLGVSLSAIDAQITGQHLGMGGHAYTPRGRVLLVGDAAGLVDPLTGEGIHSALISGQAAAAAVLEALPPPSKLSSRPEARSVRRSGETPVFSVDAPCTASGTWEKSPTSLAAAYARRLRPLQQTLAFSARAARSFYRKPARGIKAIRTPILRSLILRTYADGLPHPGLISTLAKLLT